MGLPLLIESKSLFGKNLSISFFFFFSAGTWAEWGDWSECDPTWTNGKKFRSRHCPNASLASSCDGNSTETAPCSAGHSLKVNITRGTTDPGIDSADLGTGKVNRSDEFSEKFQTAFDPPPSFSESYIALFATKLWQKCVCSYGGTFVYFMILFPMRCM